MNRNRVFPGFAYAFALSAFFNGVMALVLEAYDGSLYPNLILALGPVAFICTSLFIRKERSLTALVILQIVLIVTCCVLIFVYDPPEGIGAKIFAVFVIVLVDAFVCYASVKAPNIGQLLISMDICVAALIIMAFMISVRGASVLNCVPLVIAAVLSLGSVMIMRIDREMGVKDVVGFTVLFAALIGIVFGLVYAAAEPAGNLFVKVMIAIKDAVVFAGKAVLRFIAWLISLIPLPERTPVELEPEETQSVEYTMEEMQGTIPDGLYAVLIIIGIVILIIVLFKIRKMRVGKIGVKASANVTSGRVSFLQGLKTWLANIRKSLKMNAFLRRNRNNPLGIFYSMEKTCRHSSLERKVSETPAEFLKRIKDLISEEDRRKAADGNSGSKAEEEFFSGLYGKVNLALYGSASAAEAAASAQEDPAAVSAVMGRLRSAVRKTKIPVPKKKSTALPAGQEEAS